MIPSTWDSHLSERLGPSRALERSPKGVSARCRRLSQDVLTSKKRILALARPFLPYV
jgi:hypothetical protein